MFRLFDYRAAEPLPAPGCRVRVPFGRREVIGVVMALADRSEVGPAELKSVIDVLDEAPVLPADVLSLLSFASDYYLHPPGEVVAAALPAALRRGKPLEWRRRVVVRTGEAKPPANATRQRAALERLEAAGGRVDERTLGKLVSGWAGVRRALEAKGYVTIAEEPLDTTDPPRSTPTPGPVLNPEQARAVEQIDGAAAGFRATVLDGVTGSGKTEVYLELIRRTVARGRQTLVLVPEIGLTPQLVRRFRERLGEDPALLHSALPDTARLEAWRRAGSGQASVVLGTRSAVFTPLARLGLIVVDEEHDTSLSQQDGFRYSARDLALIRGRDAAVPVVLGSATPSLESLAAVEAGRYSSATLRSRAGDAVAPRVRLIDTARHPLDEGLSAPLASAVERELDAGGQALIYINRRGFAPALLCRDCGHIEQCRRCDARLTFHSDRQRLECHHCGATHALPTGCARCAGPMTPIGHGTERIEDVLRRRFPGERIVRIDSDTTRSREQFESALAAATDGDARVLVGTQMLSKGHHFPHLGLVGIVNADQGLFGSDYRAAERLAQSLIQVSGRAGRERRQGDVLLQTGFPDHPLLNTLVTGGYREFARRALAERRAAVWPPYARLALLRAESKQRAAVWSFLSAVAGELRHGAPPGVDIFGPVSAAMERRGGRYRAQLLFRSATRGALRRLIKPLRVALDDDARARRLRWALDVDPADVL